MLDKWAQQLEERAAAKTVESKQRYRVLIAKGERLTVKEMDELEAVARSLGLSIQTVTADAKVKARMIALTNTIADGPQLRKALADANKVVADASEKREREYNDALKHLKNVLTPIQARADGAVRNYIDGQNELEQLARSHSHLLD